MGQCGSDHFAARVKEEPTVRTWERGVSFYRTPRVGLGSFFFSFLVPYRANTNFSQPIREIVPLSYDLGGVLMHVIYG